MNQIPNELQVAIDRWREAWLALQEGDQSAAETEAQAFGDMQAAYETQGEADIFTKKAIAERILGRRLRGWIHNPIEWAIGQLDEDQKVREAYEALTPEQQAWLSGSVERDLAEELFFSDRRAGAYK